QLLKDPILVAKEIAAEEGASEKLALFAKIFDLETEEVESRAEEVEHKRVWTPSVPSL
ncbi:glutamyl-tRNA reductase, partial [Bacillus thuringiensis]